MLTIAKISKLICISSAVDSDVDCKNCVDCTFFKAEIQYVDRGIFFADINKAVTLHLLIKGIISYKILQEVPYKASRLSITL